MQFPALFSKLLILFRSFPQVSRVDLLELSQANMTEAAYQNIKKLRSGFFRRK